MHTRTMMEVRCSHEDNNLRGWMSDLDVRGEEEEVLYGGQGARAAEGVQGQVEQGGQAVEVTRHRGYGGGDSETNTDIVERRGATGSTAPGSCRHGSRNPPARCGP